jgi:hypothetical protein
MGLIFALNGAIQVLAGMPEMSAYAEAIARCGGGA